jgi:hypothetical protein
MTTLSEEGTDGISHTITVALETEDGYEDYEEFPNVVDVMNLPNNTLKFYSEDGLQMKKGARIVRSQVRGLSEASRNRCGQCEDPRSDIISAVSRDEAFSLYCPVCDEETEYEPREIDEP